MRRVAIVSPVRTAVGNFGGSLRDVSADELASTVIQEVLDRSKLDPAKVDDVILGHGYPSGENPAIGRLALLKAGLPIEVPGYQLDRRCGSGHPYQIQMAPAFHQPLDPLIFISNLDWPILIARLPSNRRRALKTTNSEKRYPEIAHAQTRTVGFGSASP